MSKHIVTLVGQSARDRAFIGRCSVLIPAVDTLFGPELGTKFGRLKDLITLLVVRPERYESDSAEVLNAVLDALRRICIGSRQSAGDPADKIASIVAAFGIVLPHDFSELCKLVRKLSTEEECSSVGSSVLIHGAFVGALRAVKMIRENDAIKASLNADIVRFWAGTLVKLFFRDPVYDSQSGRTIRELIHDRPVSGSMEGEIGQLTSRLRDDEIGLVMLESMIGTFAKYLSDHQGTVTGFADQVIRQIAIKYFSAMTTMEQMRRLRSDTV